VDKSDRSDNLKYQLENPAPNSLTDEQSGDDNSDDDSVSTDGPESHEGILEPEEEPQVSVQPVRRPNKPLYRPPGTAFYGLDYDDARPTQPRTATPPAERLPTRIQLFIGFINLLSIGDTLERASTSYRANIVFNGSDSGVDIV
jgi:hypothetical protein